MATDTTFDLKETINLPKTNFAQKANLTQREPERLNRWREMNLYTEIRRAREGREMFVLHDGPPYANADIHIGTAMNKVLKDFIVKSRAMMGYDAPYVPGYDCHGLPIETFVDKKLKEKGIVKAEMSPVAFRRACREHASEALKRQTRDFQRLGIFGEWDDPYLTMSHAYEAETARLFGRFVGRGYVFRGARPVYWCINDQTALAEAEVEYEDHTSPSIYVKFPLPADQVRELERRIAERGQAVSLGSNPVYVLIWTTTPWTLPANLAIAVHPEFDYAAIDVGNEIYIFAKSLVPVVAEKAGLGEPALLASFPGQILEGLQARHAWLDRPSVLLLDEHVTLGEMEDESEGETAEGKRAGKAGTGCVHTAPGHGNEDFLLGQKYREQLQPAYDQLRQAGALAGQTEGTEVYCPVDNAGRFTSEVERFAGLKVFEANGLIVDFLRDKNALLYTEDYSHRYPHCWRCHRPVIFRATPQWFISMDKDAVDGPSMREMALREVENVRWIPGWGRERMRLMLARRPDWCVSRQRLWGVPIPVFFCDSCNYVIADEKLIDHVANLFEKETADAWYAMEAEALLPEGFACPSCVGTRFRKETDILDVWFDSGSSSLAVLERERHLPWPSDVYLEGPDQYRGWFNSSLMIALAAHNQAPYKTVITHGWTVDGEGKAMSKSLGNTVSPNKVADELGAEILRLWVASSNYQEDVRLSQEILKRLVDAYRKLRNTARYALGNIFDFDPERDMVERENMWEVDRWALAVTDEVTRKVVEAYERFEYHVVYHTMYQYATVTLSAIYFDILKDRLYTFAPNSTGRRSAQTALHIIIDRFARLLAPILVFTSEEIWENLPGKRSASVHIAEFPKAEPGEGHKLLVETWNKLFEVRSAVQKALEEKRNEKVIGASLEAKVTLGASGETYDLLRRYESELPSILIVSQVELRREEADELRIEVEHAEGAKCERCWNWSVTVGQDERFPTLDARCVKQVTEGWEELWRQKD